MTKEEFVQEVAEYCNMPAHSVATILLAVSHVAGQALGDGEKVTIPGLVKLKAEGRYRFAHHGPTKKVVVATATSSLTKAVF